MGRIPRLMIGPTAAHDFARRQRQSVRVSREVIRHAGISKTEWAVWIVCFVVLMVLLGVVWPQ